MRRRSYQRALALSATAVITLFGPTGMAAAAPGGGHAGSQGQHGNGTATSSSHSHGHHGAGSSGGNGHHGTGNSGAHGHHGTGNSGAHGHHGNGNSGANGNHGAGNNGTGNGNGNGGQAPGTGGGPGSDGSPPGNNGNVKITGLGDLDSIPNNVAHPGCTFQVEWYGFDQGADIISTVTFESQAPTSDVAIAVAGPASVFVGADPARGGQDLDGVQAYTLSFTGVPQPQQGYHVRLTVHTPYSNGNDSKSKVFWVEPCQLTPAAPPVGADTTPQPAADTHPQVGAETKPPLTVRRPPAAAQAPPAAPGVPTAIDAGEDRGGISGVLDEVASPLPLAVTGGGLLLALTGVLLRRRTRSHPLG